MVNEPILVRYDHVEGGIEPISGERRLAQLAARNGGFVERRMVTLVDGDVDAVLPSRLWIDRSRPSVGSTIRLVRAVHRGEVDWAGQPYFRHPIGVMRLLPREADDEEKMLALLHGSLEHGQLGAPELLVRGYDECLVLRLKLLTNGPAVKGYDAFLRKMQEIADSGDLRCIRVKIADCAHNIFHPSNNYVEPLKILRNGLRKARLEANFGVPGPAAARSQYPGWIE